MGYVLEHLGDRPIDTYSSADAASFRDWLIARDLNISSIYRIFGTVRAVINLTIQEHGLECRNAFANIYLPKKSEGKRKPFPTHEIISIQKHVWKYQMKEDCCSPSYQIQGCAYLRHWAWFGVT